MKVKIITNGEIKNGLASSAKIECVQIKEDWRAYTAVLHAICICACALGLPLVLAGIIF